MFFSKAVKRKKKIIRDFCITFKDFFLLNVFIFEECCNIEQIFYENKTAETLQNIGRILICKIKIIQIEYNLNN